MRAHPNLITLAQILSRQEDVHPLSYRLAMGHRLDAWRPGQDYRRGYSASAARGGGALFDLIHLIDLSLWYFGPVVSVDAVLSKVGSLEIDGDDVANLLLTHSNGVTGHVQVDMASPIQRCEVEVMTADAVYRWTNAEGVLRRLSADGESVAGQAPKGFERNDLFLAHMRHFLERMESPGVRPLCSLEDGMTALRIALAARESDGRGGRVRTIDRP